MKSKEVALFKHFFLFKQKKKARRSLFSTTEVGTIRSLCSDIIKEGPLSERRVKEALGETEIWKNYKFAQIRTRLVYERTHST